MKNIKVRVYCEDCGKEYDAYSFENGEVCTNGDFINNCENYNHKRHEMLWTGKKDKLGNDICAGHILFNRVVVDYQIAYSYESQEDWVYGDFIKVGIVRFSSSKGMTLNGFVVKLNEDGQICFIEHTNKYLKNCEKHSLIMGNKWQNKDLVKTFELFFEKKDKHTKEVTEEELTRLENNQEV